MGFSSRVGSEGSTADFRPKMKSPLLGGLAPKSEGDTMLRTRVGRCGARCKPQGPSRSCGKDAAVEVVGSGAYLSILPCMLTSTNVRDMHEVIWADQCRRRNRHDSIGIPYHDSGRKNRGCQTFSEISISQKWRLVGDKERQREWEDIFGRRIPR